MTKEQREKLRELAKAATPGEWDVASDAPSYAIYVKGGGRRIVQTANQNNYKRFGPSNPWHGIGSHSDAAYIASANPQTVIALLDRVDELEAAAEKMGKPAAWELPSGRYFYSAKAHFDLSNPHSSYVTSDGTVQPGTGETFSDVRMQIWQQILANAPPGAIPDTAALHILAFTPLAYLASPPAVPEWQPIETAPHNKPVLIHYKNGCGKGRTIKAEFIPANTIEASGEYDDHCEYNEALDNYFWPEGWHEMIDNWGEYLHVVVNETPTHWMPLPEAPVGDSHE